MWHYLQLAKEKLRPAIQKTTVATYPLINGAVHGFMVQKYFEYLYQEEIDNDKYYWPGYVLAAGAGVIASIAMWKYYYPRINKGHGHSHSHINPDSIESNEPDDDHSSHEDESLLHQIEHGMLRASNFSFAVGGIYYLLHANEGLTDTQQKLLTAFVVGTLSGLYSEGEVAAHETFLHDHNEASFWIQFTDLLWTSIKQEKDWLPFFLKIWLHWGSFGSHAQSWAYGMKVAIDSIGLMFFNGTLDSKWTWIITAIPAIYVAALHTATEVTAYHNSEGLRKVLKDLGQMDKRDKQLAIAAYLTSSIILTVAHALPESFALPSELVKGRKTTMTQRLCLSGGFGLTFGLPDVIVTYALTAETSTKALMGKEGERSSLLRPSPRKANGIN